MIRHFHRGASGATSRIAVGSFTMKLLVAAVGKMKAGPEQALYREYARRLSSSLTCKECKNEAQLLAACAGYDRIVALDERGTPLSSREFSDELKKFQQQGYSSVAFMIGGAEGLDQALLKKANLIWSFGRVTWPHMLVRSLLVEQLYRAQSIMNGHPYHKD